MGTSTKMADDVSGLQKKSILSNLLYRVRHTWQPVVHRVEN